MDAPRRRSPVFQFTSNIWVFKKPRSHSIDKQFSPHDNTAPNYSCSACTKSNGLSVCHKLWSILWQLLADIFYRPQNVRSAYARQLEACRKILWANFWHFSHSVQSLILELGIVDARLGDFDATTRCVIYQFAVPFDSYFFACLFMSCQRSHHLNQAAFQQLLWRSVIRTSTRFLLWLTCTMTTSQVHLIKKRRGFLQMNEIHQYSPRRFQVVLSAINYNVVHETR